MSADQLMRTQGDGSGSCFGRTRGSGTCRTLTRVGRVQRVFAAYGFDIVIVAAAAQSVVGTTLRAAGARADGARLCLGTLALGAGILVLIGRRWFPFAVGGGRWLGRAALSFLDPQLISTQA